MTAPHDPAPPLEAMLALTEQLTQLLEGQARAFEAHRPQDVAPELPEVARLADLYRAGASAVRGQPTLLADAAPALRARLLAATQAFEAALDRQGRALGASKTVTEGLVKAIAEEVARRRGLGQPYGPGPPRPAAATAITLNQRA